MQHVVCGQKTQRVTEPGAPLRVVSVDCPPACEVRSVMEAPRNLNVNRAPLCLLGMRRAAQAFR